MAYLQCTVVTGSACVMQVRGSGSLANPTLFSVDGANGRLLEVTDDLSCSIFSANTIAGLPVIEAFANYCVSMGQFGGHKFEVTCTSIRGGKCTTASGTYSFVGGGCCNVASGCRSFVGGGVSNTASGIFSFIGGGCMNTASGNRSTVAGGIANTASGNCSFVGGGSLNSASAKYSIVAGGKSNTASGYASTIGGGISSTASGGYSFVGGGISNTASGGYSFVGAGVGNKATPSYSIVTGGYANCVCTNSVYSSIVGGRTNFINNSCYGFIGGGYQNCINETIVGAAYSSIVGGGFNCVTGTCNIHIVGGNINGNTNNYTYVNNLCQTGGGLSDCRVKNTIQPLEFGLDHIAQLQPVSFCWNGDSTCHKKYGFIAQNVQQAMSCVVTCNKLHRLGPDGTQILDKEEGEPLLEFEKDAVYASYVNAFKELKAENDTLKQRITAIENILKNNNLL
jgi:hypothetical protein